jgi:WhiB family transcriptional regulator, redox-sensing transcriptional regulator
MRVPYEYENPLCRETSPESFYPDKGEDKTHIRLVRSICGRCSHQAECAEWGITKEAHGIWGGLSPSERRRIRMKRRITLKEEEVA